MKANERRTLGMDRPLQLEWLDAVAGQLASGATLDEARAFTWKFLEGAVSGSTAQSARGKTLTVLARIWLTVPAGNEPVRADALQVISGASADERLGLHWAMMSAAYPFFVDLATNVGKLLALNGDCSLAQLNRRLVGVWGDRSTVRTAAQRIVRSMVQWGALEDGGRAGVYVPRKQRIALPANVAALLVEGLIIAADSGAPLDQLVSHAAAFPFDLRLTANDLRRHARLRVHRQGDQTDFIERELPRKSEVPPSSSPAKTTPMKKAPTPSAKPKRRANGKATTATPPREEAAARSPTKKTPRVKEPAKPPAKKTPSKKKKGGDRQLSLLPEDP